MTTPFGICPCCGNTLLVRQDVQFRLESNTLVSSDYAIIFPSKHGKLFALFWKHRNSERIITRQMLWDELYALDIDGGPDPKIIDVMVCRMRRLIANTNIDIVTVWGRGYVLRPKNSTASPVVTSTPVKVPA